MNSDRVTQGKQPMSANLAVDLDEAMMDIYRRALGECGYKATRFLHMLHEHRGLETARLLLHAPGVSEGYIALWERQRLDLTVEAVILNRKCEELFTDEERDIARRRLADYGYSPVSEVSPNS